MILDATDLRLLHFLQQDGRISNQELAEKVALSPSACLRRLRLLESEGVISGYRAVLNAEQLGIELEAIVHLVAQAAANAVLVEYVAAHGPPEAQKHLIEGREVGFVVVNPGAL